jgi:methylenetetrahydrofolate--tRNA-(uracil-5-)-methyltransferase
LFAAEITRAIEAESAIEIRREEVAALDPEKIWIVASGPLTSDALAQEIARVTGSERLFFYDSISPIVDAESIDLSVAFRASRYGKSLDGTADYLNCPFDRGQYEAFLDALLAAEGVPAHIEADSPRYFEACLPIEEIARRGRDTLRFGPMKPMGLTDPRTGRRPYAVVQLRQETRGRELQPGGVPNHMRLREQQRVLRMIPVLKTPSSCARPGAPQHLHQRSALLTPTLQLRTRPEVFFAGQISG